jgi:hypothetical protein
MSQWMATCVDQSSWHGVVISLIPAFDDPAKCAAIRDQTLQSRCRDVNTYAAAFDRIGSFDEVQRALDVCSRVTADLIRHRCYTQLGEYAERSAPRSTARLELDPRVTALFAAMVAGERRERMECEPSSFRLGPLDCRADYGDGPDGVVSVMIQEWSGLDETPREIRERMTEPPPYLDAAGARVTNERRSGGRFRMYRGPETVAADWISGNRYIRLFFRDPTDKESAFVKHFLDAFPSTLH